jgi:hypothetical protein
MHYPLEVKTLCSPLHSSKQYVECEHHLGVNENVNILPRDQSSPLGANSHCKNLPQLFHNIMYVPWQKSPHELALNLDGFRRAVREDDGHQEAHLIHLQLGLGTARLNDRKDRGQCYDQCLCHLRQLWAKKIGKIVLKTNN